MRQEGAFLGNCPPYDFFLPDHWVPHRLLAFDLEPGKLVSVLEDAMHLRRPFDGRTEEIDQVEFQPVKHLFAFLLAEG